MIVEIKLFVNMDTQGNTYLVIDEDKNCCMIDPGSLKIKKIISYMKENDLNLTGILLTHGHYDHIIGIPDIIDYKKELYLGILLDRQLLGGFLEKNHQEALDHRGLSSEFLDGEDLQELFFQHQKAHLTK